MKTTTRLCLALGAILFSTSLANARPVVCQAKVNGKLITTGTCDFQADADGSFYLYDSNGYFYVVSVYAPGRADGYWNGYDQASHAHDDLGPLTRHDACWSNRRNFVCAW